MEENEFKETASNLENAMQQMNLISGYCSSLVINSSNDDEAAGTLYLMLIHERGLSNISDLLDGIGKTVSNAASLLLDASEMKEGASHE